MDHEELDLVLINLRQILEQNDINQAVKIIENLRPADQADIVAELDEDDQIAVLTGLEPSDSADLLEEMDDHAAVAVAELLTPGQLAGILDEMEKDEAADFLTELTDEQVAKIVQKMDEPEDVLTLMEYPNDTAGGLMTIAAITLRPNWTVEQAFMEIRKLKSKSDSSYYLYVVDEFKTLLGVVGLRDLVAEPPESKISSIMETKLTTVFDTTDQEECAQTLSRYSHLVVPVIDKNNRFLGVITADDLIEVTEDAGTEDMYRMVGITGEDRILGTPIESVMKRLPWLGINMLTLFFAITVIDKFESVIAGMVVLAVFLPLVSGEGGNAGSQTATIIVRGLAVGEMTSRDGKQVLKKELIVTIINGVIIGIGTGVIVYFWKGESIIAIAIFFAMICNFTLAGCVGVLVPLGLKKINIDPALASAAFVTAFTDTFGFLFFLGIVSLMI